LEKGVEPVDQETRSSYERAGGSCWELGVAAGDRGVNAGAWYSLTPNMAWSSYHPGGTMHGPRLAARGDDLSVRWS
jgi:hypothetical protein